MRQTQNIHEGVASVWKMAGLTVTVSVKSLFKNVFFIVYYGFKFPSLARNTHTHHLPPFFLSPVFRKEVSLLLLHCYSYRTLPGTLTQ